MIFRLRKISLFIFSLLIFVSAGIHGCADFNLWPFGQNDEQKNMVPVQESDARSLFSSSNITNNTSNNAGMTALVVEFEVATIEFPDEDLRHVRKVWSHTNQLRSELDTLRVMAKNGLRCGVLKEDSTPAVNAILDVSKAETNEQLHSMMSGNLLELEIDTVESPRNIFRYDKEGRLSGKTIPAGDMIVSFQYFLDSRLSSVREMYMNFEIREDLGRFTFESRDGIISQVPDYEIYRFEGLSSRFRLVPEEMLIIGAQLDDANKHLPGQQFFTFTRAGKQFHRMIIIKNKIRKKQI